MPIACTGPELSGTQDLMPVADQTTFIKIDRNIMDWRWYQDPNTFRLFVHLILRANIRDHDFE